MGALDLRRGRLQARAALSQRMGTAGLSAAPSSHRNEAIEHPNRRDIQQRKRCNAQCVPRAVQQAWGGHCVECTRFGARRGTRERNARTTHGASKTPLAPPPAKASSHRHLASGGDDVAVAVLRAVATGAAAPELRVTRRTAAVTTSEPHPGWRRFLHDATTVPGVPRSIIKLCETATRV